MKQYEGDFSEHINKPVMDSQEAIKNIKAYAYYADSIPKDVAFAMEAAIIALEDKDKVSYWEKEAKRLAAKLGEIKLKQENDGWISCDKIMPKVEEEVEITVKRVCEGKEYIFTCRAFYEDGNTWREDSGYCWNDFDNVIYDEVRDDWLVPEGWYEPVLYAEEAGIVGDFVIAWRHLTKPYKDHDHEE